MRAAWGRVVGTDLQRDRWLLTLGTASDSPQSRKADFQTSDMAAENDPPTLYFLSSAFSLSGAAGSQPFR